MLSKQNSRTTSAATPHPAKLEPENEIRLSRPAEDDRTPLKRTAQAQKKAVYSKRATDWPRFSDEGSEEEERLDLSVLKLFGLLRSQ
ncbi:hypothetical protein NPIL_160661 [Nephila pilipes]|uniref:Uncharacterized protein n=1 Tax=Nephila pilipes TaxID=299642 RepID=A0A8X6QYJ0_NEPPI|nr:hypothetical protein NPIL_160661 [Nephila pilipes]